MVSAKTSSGVIGMPLTCEALSFNIMKEIKLPHGFTTLVDDEDFEYLNKWKWNIRDLGYTKYVIRQSLVSDGVKRGTSIFMHRVVINTPKGMETDHINHNGLDNRKINLRICTGMENHRNKRPKGEFLGVSWYKRDSKWRAYINIDQKQIHLGYFENKIEAARFRDEASKKYFGEFAYLNFKK